MKRVLIMSAIILICAGGFVSAGANDSLAIGGQLGFLASGVVIDAPLGPLDIQAGVNYPLGFEYIAWALESEGDFFFPYFVVTADVTYPISLGENFDLKIGGSMIGFTDFEEGIFGAAGVALKGEYWLPEKDTGLFINLNAPMVLFISTGDGVEVTPPNPLLPILGLVSSTFGVLWRL